MPDFCRPMELPPHLQVQAALTAIAANPRNRPHPALVRALHETLGVLSPQHLAVMTQRYWGQGGVNLTVSFLEPTPADLQARIVAHANAWSQWANVRFVLVTSGGQVRITLHGQGYWSYVGPDILQIPANQPTMSLQGFSMATPESEFRRVVRHEFGHTIGCPHEHLRREILKRLNQAETIAWGRQVLGWNEQMVRSNILTPVEESELIATPHADQDSIMAYMLPASITNDGLPIRGGSDIDPIDQAFIASVYPLAAPPPPPPPPGGVTQVATLHPDRRLGRGRHLFSGPTGNVGLTVTTPLTSQNYPVAAHGTALSDATQMGAPVSTIFDELAEIKTDVKQVNAKLGGDAAPPGGMSTFVSAADSGKVFVTFTWNPASDNGATVSYQLEIFNPDGGTFAAPSLTDTNTSFVQVMPDDPGTFSARLTAFNVAGVPCVNPAIASFVPHVEVPPPLPGDPTGFGISVAA